MQNKIIWVWLVLNTVGLLWVLGKGGVVPRVGTPKSEIGSRGAALVGEAKSLPSWPAYPALHPEVKERLTVEESSVSLVVKKVPETVEKIVKYVKTQGGWVVSSQLTSPKEAPFARLVVRLPRQKLRPAVVYLRQLATKVVSVQIKGRDVTDEYFDLKARLETLSKTKKKLEDLQEMTRKIDEILRIQKELSRLQEEIDQLQGRAQYLEKTAQYARLSVYLATDELALPYRPQPGLRPKVVFKKAVRSLVGTLQTGIKLSIWLGVYSVLWLPPLLGWWIWKKKRGR